jgi:CelD/BcsL family acetyltransferase involved in cellulose biosynthesis
MNEKEINSELQCRIVRGLDSIAELSGDWDNLFKRAHKAPAYFSRAWVQTFITEKRVKGRPLLITVWSDTKLVALLPLTVCNYLGIKVAKVAPTTVLCYTGILIDPNYQEAIRIVVEALFQNKIAHVFYNKYLSSLDEPTNELIAELIRHNFIFKRWKRHVCMWTKLEPSFEQVLESRRTGEQRRWLLRKERRVFKQGDVDVVCYAGKEITPEITARVAAIQKDSWLKAEGKAILNQTFYQKLLIELGKAGIGCIWLMTKDGDDVAFIYALRVKNRLYPKWMSYRNKYGASSSLSFGKILYIQMVRDACNKGISILDLGFGTDRWKNVWATERQSIDLIISGRGFIGQLSSFICGMLLMCAKYKWRLHQHMKKFRMVNKK